MNFESEILEQKYLQKRFAFEIQKERPLCRSQGVAFRKQSSFFEIPKLKSANELVNWRVTTEQKFAVHRSVDRVMNQLIN